MKATLNDVNELVNLLAVATDNRLVLFTEEYGDTLFDTYVKILHEDSDLNEITTVHPHIRLLHALQTIFSAMLYGVFIQNVKTYDDAITVKVYKILTDWLTKHEYNKFYAVASVNHNSKPNDIYYFITEVPQSHWNNIEKYIRYSIATHQLNFITLENEETISTDGIQKFFTYCILLGELICKENGIEYSEIIHGDKKI